MIFLIWAEKSEYSDLQTKIVCYFKTREEAEAMKVQLQAAEKSTISWERWRYSVEECGPGVTFE